MHRIAMLASADPDEPEQRFDDQTALIIEAMFAQLIRHSRSGTGKGLRESGFTETADELGF